MEEQSNYYEICIKCNEKFSWNIKDVFWEYAGFNDVKMVTCPYCGCKNPIKYKKQTNSNYDSRLFYY